MVKPWDEWLSIVLPERGRELTINPTDEEWLTRMKEFIADIFTVSVLVMQCSGIHLQMDLGPTCVYKMPTIWLGKSHMY